MGNQVTKRMILRLFYPMASALSQFQIDQYHTDGYTPSPHFFDHDEVLLMQEELQRLQDAGMLRNIAKGKGRPHTEEKVNLLVSPLSPKSEVFRALPYAAKVREAVSLLIGPDFHLQLDQIFLKPAHHGAGTSWHQDNAYFHCPDPHQGVGMWVAIHDAHRDNGTLHMVPGSHLRLLEHLKDEGSDGHVICHVDETVEQVVPVEMAAGGVVFFNYGVAHCTKGNQTDHPRAGLALHFVATKFLDLTRAASQARPKLAGPGFSFGRDEYGVNLQGDWERRVAEVSALV